jgi:hypothetical protein
MPPVRYRMRFRMRTIMIAIAALAVLMIPVRIMVSLYPSRLDLAEDLALGIGIVSIVYFTPFIGLTIALWLAIQRVIRKWAVNCTPHRDRSPEPDRSGEPERVSVKNGMENHQRTPVLLQVGA